MLGTIPVTTVQGPPTGYNVATLVTGQGVPPTSALTPTDITIPTVPVGEEVNEW